MRKKIKHWMKRSIKFFLRLIHKEEYFMEHIWPKFRKEALERTMVDVMFINGCDWSVPHPPRYRVTHQREQLEANNVRTDEVFYTDVTKNLVKYANAFVIFRCPYTDAVGELIEEAKRENKKVWYDIDDLVIDTKYTDLIPYVQQLNEQEKEVYDDGVKRMGKTLSLCDGAITTTKVLAEELAHYVPDVFINRNTASDEMYKCSEEALKLKQENYIRDIVLDEKQGICIAKRKEGEVRLGYFSGSITHNADVKLIMSAVCKILKKYQYVKLYLVGELDLPDELKPYKTQIVVVPFMKWQLLPRLISMVDINLAPLEDTIFNRAKSENKWVEASLVKVVTVASDVGAFSEMVENGVTGCLCQENQWFDTLEKLVTDIDMRNKISETAYNYAREKCLTIYSGKRLASYITEKTSKTVILILPSTEISGGINVALRHVLYLKKAGYSVTILASNPSLQWIEYEDECFPVLHWEKTQIDASFEKGIATMWLTTAFLEKTNRVHEKYYLVQNYETDFYEPGSIYRVMANRTYALPDDIQYITISKWCQKWLYETYEKKASFVYNGIERKLFPRKTRDFSGKIRILIEGDSSVEYKGVDESFRITNALDHNRFEIWYMSYNGVAKEWYHVDRFLHRVPYDEVGMVYAQCDILLKSSRLESFSYPPLEMMATDGFIVAVANGGNIEYLEDDRNCLFYEQGNVEEGIQCIERLIKDAQLRDRLLSHYEETVEPRDWNKVEESILELYGAKG